MRIESISSLFSFLLTILYKIKVLKSFLIEKRIKNPAYLRDNFTFGGERDYLRFALEGVA